MPKRKDSVIQKILLEMAEDGRRRLDQEQAELDAAGWVVIIGVVLGFVIFCCLVILL